MSESELDSLLGEVGGACNYENMVNMFQTKMADDVNDSEDLIIQAFKAYDLNGKVDVKMFQHALRTWGEKISNAEMKEVFDEFDIDEDYFMKTKELTGMFVAVKEEEKKEAAPPPQEDDGEAKKKKKKKKTAAK